MEQNVFSPSVPQPHSLPAARPRSNRRGLAYLLRQLLHFAWQQALSCLFPILLFLTFALTQHVAVPGLHRYDLILLVCLAAQAGLYWPAWRQKTS